MLVVSVLNQKGGSGKTTIATHLSRAFQLVGHDVLLIDSDPQGSARDWAAVRDDSRCRSWGSIGLPLRKILRLCLTKI